MMHWSWNNARLAMLSGSALLLFFAGSGCSNGAGKPGTLPGTEPPVVVLDTPWSQGASLASYEILGEEAGAGVEKLFTVRLSLKKPERTEEVQYHVLGVGPVMVFRDQDYLRNINMENGPRLIKPGRQPRRPRR
jgi:hypothetical protein